MNQKKTSIILGKSKNQLGLIVGVAVVIIAFLFCQRLLNFTLKAALVGTDFDSEPEFVVLVWLVLFQVILLLVAFLCCSYMMQLLSSSQGLKMAHSSFFFPKPSVLLVFSLYNFLLLPYTGKTYSRLFFLNLRLPSALVDLIYTYKEWLTALRIIVVIFVVYVAIKLLYTIPLVLLTDIKLKAALKKSWQFSFKQTVLFLLKILVEFFARKLMVYWSVYSLGFLLQLVLQIPITKMEFFIVCVLRTFLTINFIWGLYSLLQQILIQLRLCEPSRKNVKGLLTLLGPIILLFHGITYQPLIKPTNQSADLIFHRGVIDKRGVENTLAAFESVSAESPDYLEIDVQWTADHQFVVFHDKSLLRLAGKCSQINELTWSVLEAIRLKEGNQTATMALFDEYLSMAEQQGQKLLIELKIFDLTTAQEFIQEFMTRYGATLLGAPHQLQSPQLTVVEFLKNNYPEIQTGYILPFVISFPPQTQADFYSVNQQTVSATFIELARQRGKEVYVWGVNAKLAADNMLDHGAAAIITGTSEATRRSVSYQDYFLQLAEFAVYNQS